MHQYTFVEETVTTDFVGREPGWIIKSGISLIFIVFCLFLLLFWFVKFPDTIQSQIRLTSINSPVELVAKVSGKVERLLVDEGNYVVLNTPLVLLESDAKYEELKQLHHILSIR